MCTTGIVDFVAWVAVVALSVSFIMGLMVKWRILEWLQVHAPNDFILELVSCKFCLSFWLSLLVSVGLAIVFGGWIFLLIPLCSTIIARELW